MGKTQADSEGRWVWRESRERAGRRKRGNAVAKSRAADGEHSMGVPAEVPEHMAEFSKWLFCVNDPSLLGDAAHQSLEGLWVFEVFESDEGTLCVERA